jgi:hypothetical protein
MLQGRYYFNLGIRTLSLVSAYLNLCESNPRDYEQGKIKTFRLQINTQDKSNDIEYKIKDAQKRFIFNQESCNFETKEICSFLKTRIPRLLQSRAY